MGRTTGAAAHLVPQQDDAVAPARTRVLAIEGRGRRRDAPPGLEAHPDVVVLGYDEFLTLREAFAADVVVAPMVGDSFDCIDVAQHLVDAGFRGRFRVLTPALPRPGVLRSEVRSLFPGLDVDIVVQTPIAETPIA